MTVFDYFTQGLGLFAFVVSVLIYQIKDQKLMFTARSINMAVWTLHYAMLGALPVALTMVINGLRMFLSVRAEGRAKAAILAVSFIMVSVISLIVADTLMDAFVILPTFLMTMALWHHEKYGLSRFLMAGCCTGWIVVGLIEGSVGEVLSSGFALGSVIIAAIRHTSEDKNKD